MPGSFLKSRVWANCYSSSFLVNKRGRWDRRGKYLCSVLLSWVLIIWIPKFIIKMWLTEKVVLIQVSCMISPQNFNIRYFLQRQYVSFSLKLFSVSLSTNVELYTLPLRLVKSAPLWMGKQNWIKWKWPTLY